MELVRELSFNLAIIMLLLFIFNLWVERYYKNSLPKVLGIFGFLLSIMICLIFSTRHYGVMVDLRQIPILIGGFYFGFGPLLTFFSLLFRGVFFGVDSAFWTVLPLYILLAIYLKYAHPWFLKQNAKKRLCVVLTTAVIMNILIFIGLLITGHSANGLKAVTITTIIQCIGTCMISYLIEEMKQNKFLIDQMVKSQKIELVSHMSAAISHEVRNPLTAVNGFLQLALEDPKMEDTTRGYIDIALTELHAAEQVIKDYLTVGQPSLQTIERFDSNEELRKMIKSLQPMANMNSVELNIETIHPCLIHGDKNRFRQCFLNILKNCIEAMPNGGRLCIDTEALTDEVKIQITDSGIGMTQEQINRLGEPYFSTKGQKGTGLGLMVSFSIIRELKGTIKIKSTVGKGTVFVVTLPAVNK
ncbi:ATP-binding protein [Neobacillus rhizosphaerae]|uniref:ATP-binding protein n=1 Tax=Neobacillus rhizosphaerae TaxID=2880965 RepID=UPI003D2D8EC1